MSEINNQSDHTKGTPHFVVDPELADSIRQHVATGRKADFLDVLHGFRNKLTKISLSPRCDVDTAQAFRDAVREEIILNSQSCMTP